MEETTYDDQKHLIEALIKARIAFEPITKDGKANYGKYATLDNIIKCTDKGLSDNGLNIKHHTEYRDGKKYLITTLRHISNCKPDVTDACIDDFDNGNARANGIQQYGGNITYLKRYNIAMLLNLAIDEDNDGNNSNDNGAAKKGSQKSKEQIPPENSDIVLGYIARINEMETIFEWRKWVEKHTPELETLSEDDKKPIRKLLASRKKELEDKQAKINADKGNLLGEEAKPEHKDPTA